MAEVGPMAVVVVPTRGISKGGLLCNQHRHPTASSAYQAPGEARFGEHISHTK